MQKGNIEAVHAYSAEAAVLSLAFESWKFPTFSDYKKSITLYLQLCQKK